MRRVTAGVAFGFILGLAAWWQDVPTSLTIEDKVAIASLLQGREVQAMAANYDDQIHTIAAAQAAVLDASPRYSSIPSRQTREPADLLRWGQGLCYDRSRSIEKSLAALGFEVRHVAIYRSIPDLVLPTDAPSHALSEVRTERGWMLVDSVSHWLGIDASGGPVSAYRLSKGGVDLAEPVPTRSLAGHFVPVIGLYSRHGQFYPPFTLFPDVNWRDFAMNFISD